MELVLCLGLLIVLPERNGNFCLGPSAVLSAAEVQGRSGLAQPEKGSRVLCTASLRMHSMSLPINVSHALIVLKYEMYLLYIIPQV